jgi:lactoylglutathione lyase
MTYADDIRKIDVRKMRKRQGSERQPSENSSRSEGVAVLDGPRRTGDGYYESVVLDPEGNRIEITA